MFKNNSFLKRIVTTVTKEASNRSKIIIVAAGLLVYLLILSSYTRFYNGDAGINGLMIFNIQKLKYFSWYFYGQYYFGNLAPLVISFLSLFTGHGFFQLSIWEAAFYFTSILFILLTVKNIKNWQVASLVLILSYFVKYSEYIWHPQGFSFATLIICFLYWYCYNLVEGKFKIGLASNLIMGTFTTLSLWHYPLYIIICPIYLLILVVKYKTDKESLNYLFKNLGIFSVGCLIGLIPLVFGYFSTEGKNIEWYFLVSGTDKGLKDRLYSVIYYLGQIFFFFMVLINPSEVSKTNVIKIFTDQILTNPINLIGLLSVLFIAANYIKKLTNLKKEWLPIVFLATLFVIILTRGVAADLPLYSNVRYSMPFLLIFILLGLVSTNNNWPKKSSLKEVFNNVSNFLIISLTLINLTFVVQTLTTRYTGLQPYEVVYKDLTEKYQVKYLYCYNYFEYCGQLAYLAAINDTFILETRDESGDIDSARNPINKDKISQAQANGEQIYSFSYLENVGEGDDILENYTFRSGRKYALVKINSN